MPTEVWIRFWLAGWGLPFSVYVAAQSITVLLLRGPARKLALIPIPIMVVVLIVTYLGFIAESNLWPIWLILMSPLALLYLVALVLVASAASIKKQRTR